jgi:uncharacterized protein HemX
VSGAAGGPTRPRLVAVPPSQASSPAPPAARPAWSASAARGSRWVWVLAVLLGLCFAGLAWQSRRAAQLADSLAASEARLRAAEARLAAYDAYLGAVRSRVGELRDQLEGLAGVLAADPAEGVPPRE